MTAARWQWWVSALALLLPFVVIAGVTRTEPSSAAGWLQQMGSALVERTYDGEFLHLAAGQAERLRILHAADVAEGAERLISLSGVGREIVRRGAVVSCYLPDQKRVLVESPEEQGLLLGTLPRFDVQSLQANYQLLLGSRSRGLLGRPTQVVEVRPRDAHRFGYRLWLDVATGMPVRSDLYDQDGRVLDQVLFIRLDFPSTLAAKLLNTSIDPRGYTVVNQRQHLLAAPSALPWGTLPLPPGFKLISATEQVVQSGQPSARHLVLSDGLATVSVFVEPITSGQSPREGQGAVGSAYAMSLILGANHVTAIGEVPADTVRLIALSIEAATGLLR